jgi:3-deoxy-D-manno-octulosonic-acid transferase
MILFLYNLALFAALVASAPWWLFRMATTRKYRQGLLERLGLIRPKLSWPSPIQPNPSQSELIQSGPIPPDSAQSERGGHKTLSSPGAPEAKPPLLWIHAVSVGEVLAVSRLIQALDAALPEFFIVVSTTTRTGQELARERFGAGRVFYCPLDLPWAVRSCLEALQPRLLVLAETEFWPNLLSGCYRRRIPVAVVNARISDRSRPRYRRLRWLWRPFLSRLSRVLAQSETDAGRLEAIGCRPERVSVAGNLKFDVRAAVEAEATRALKRRADGLRLVVAGSTLEGEEAALLEAWPRLLAADAQLALVLAPRHPERFGAVAALLDRSGVAWVRRSDWRTAEPGSRTAGNFESEGGEDPLQFGQAKPHQFRQAKPLQPVQKPLQIGQKQFQSGQEPLLPSQIVLLDTIGELASVYSLASVAFVGGSLIPAGGHNPLEPAQFGVPIVMGPHYANFRSITEDLLAHQALCIAAKEELAATLTGLLADSARAESMGERARQVFASQAGATGRAVEAIQELLLAREETEPPA